MSHILMAGYQRVSAGELADCQRTSASDILAGCQQAEILLDVTNPAWLQPQFGRGSNDEALQQQLVRGKVECCWRVMWPAAAFVVWFWAAVQQHAYLAYTEAN